MFAVKMQVNTNLYAHSLMKQENCSLTVLAIVWRSHSIHLTLFFFTMTQQPHWDRASSMSWIHNHTQLDPPHSVGLLWTSDQPDAETSTWQRTTLTIDIHASGGIWNHNPRKRAAADLRLRPRGHWVRYFTLYRSKFSFLFAYCFLEVIHSKFWYVVYLN